MHDGEGMRIFAFLTALFLFITAPVFAEPTDDAKKAECIAFYDENKSDYEAKLEKLLADDTNEEVTENEKKQIDSQ